MRKSVCWVRVWVFALAVFGAFGLFSGGSAEDGAVHVVFTEEGPSWDGGRIAWSDQVLTIAGEGVYSLSGSCKEGRIVVEAGKKGNASLILNGLSVETASGNALEIASAKTVTIHMAEGTENRVSALSEASAVYSRGDVVLTGTGSLEIVSAGKHGIQSADGVTVQGGDILINAAGSGVRAHDFVRMEAGQIRIVSSGDGIRATGDEQKQGSGWIEIGGGRLTIRSERDGIQAETNVLIADGSLDIIAGGGADRAAARGETWGGWRYEEEEETDEISQKGIKTGEALEIRGGEIRIDSVDDAIHSNHAAAVSGGRAILRSGDDGIHADDSLTVSGGTVQIEQSYEGLEANRILITGGSISVYADNDGLNAYGGTDGSRWGRRAPAPDGKPSAMPELMIEGGELYISAEGDGLDSNGHIYVKGGHIVVDGPSASMNGALDSGAENGGEMEISGGTVLAIGSSGMAEVFGASSSQCSFRYNGLPFSAGDAIRVEDAEGTVLIEYRAARSGNSVVFSAPSLAVGDQLLLTVGTASERIALTETTTSYGGSGRGNWW